MSMMMCDKCEQNKDSDFIEFSKYGDNVICESCHETLEEELQGLAELGKETDAFASEVFDWVKLLKHDILSELYDFQTTIENRIKKEKGKLS